MDSAGKRSPFLIWGKNGAEGFQRAQSCMGVSVPKGSRGRSRNSSVSIAPSSPPQRRNPLLAGKSSYGRKTSNPVAPIWRDNVQVVDRASWGRICGCAKLLAGTLRCLRLCWRLPWDWSPAEQLGRCPKPHKGAPPLDPARGNPPLTPPRDSVGLSSMLLPRVYPFGDFLSLAQTATDTNSHRTPASSATPHAFPAQ